MALQFICLIAGAAIIGGMLGVLLAYLSVRRDLGD